MKHHFPEGERIETLGTEETPDGFVWQNAPHQILEVENRWTVHRNGRDPGSVVQREYLKVVTDTGLVCHIYQDLISGGWFLARVYD